MSEKINAVWQYTVYEGDNGYIVCRYKNKKTQEVFQASGYFLPDDKALTVNLFGEWETYKGRPSFSVEQFDIELPVDEEGTISYLRSLRCGIGEKAAKILFDCFGASLWQVIEETPEKLKQTKGCSRINTEKLVQRYNQTMQMRNLMSLIRSTDSSGIKMVQNLASKLGDDAVGKIRRNPYLICDYHFSFTEADMLAQRVSFDRNRPERTSAAIIAVLRDAEAQGHLYLPIGQLVYNVAQVIRPNSASLNTSESAIRNTIAYMVDKGEIQNDDGAIYRMFRFKEEIQIASDLVRLSSAQKPRSSDSLDAYISEYEASSNIHLDSQQRKAIIESFASCVHVITGGPGTGKTTILKGILHCHHRIAKEKGFTTQPLLMAPTGRAARRMTEATGYAACTIHKALGLLAESEQESLLLAAERLEASIIIVDEASMLDNHLAATLFRAVPAGTQIIVVGDIDQLPSVGCGNVLREIINSKCISVTRLDVIFRQASGNNIIVNAKKIREGEQDLDWDPASFTALNAPAANDVYNIACSLYQKCVSKYGMDQVILLNPYRAKGAISSSAFNNKLQNILNPLKPGMDEMKVGNTLFRVGDRVMQTKNTEVVANGDIGYITMLSKQANNRGKMVPVCEIKFPDVTVEYERKDMDNVVLAYCTTVHKAQGSEYDTVIVVMHDSHNNMLRRNLIYTAITRAVNRVAIIGTETALNTAIRTDVIDQRNTKLGARLRDAKGGVGCQSKMANLLENTWIAEFRLQCELKSVEQSEIS